MTGLRAHLLGLAALAALAACRTEPESGTEGGNGQTSAQADAPPVTEPPKPDLAPENSVAPSGTTADGQNFTYPTDGQLQIVGNSRQYEIVLPTDVLFDFDRSNLRPEAEPLLRQLKAHFDANPANQVHVRGHTDSRGETSYNLTLSQRRAGAVCDWLRRETPVRGITNCIGRGEGDPVAPNENPDGSDNPEGRQRNRRVNIGVIVYPDANAMIERAREQSRRAQGR